MLNAISHQAYFELAFLHAGKQDLQSAIGSLQTAVKLQPLFPDYRYYLGTLLMDTGKIDESIEEFKRSLTLNPEYGHSALHLASALLEKGDPEGVLGVLKHSPCVDSWPEALVLAAKVYIKKGQQENAQHTLERALEIDPTNYEVQELLNIC